MTFLRYHGHLCQALPHSRDEVIHAWLHRGYGFEHIHLCKRTETTCVVPVLLQQPVPFAVSRMLLAILAPVLGMLVWPTMVAVALVGSVLGIGGHLFALPLRFSRPLAGLVRTETLSLGTGIRHKETPAMDTAHLAVHGFLLREAVFSQSGFDRKNKNHAQSKCGRKYPFRNARSGEEPLRGQFPERCPWFTFSPVVLADFLTGDNIILWLEKYFGTASYNSMVLE